MKSIKKAIIVLVILIVASLGGYLIFSHFQNKDNSKKEAAKNELNLFSFNANDCTKVDIRNESGDYTAEFIDSEWKLTSTDEFVVNDSLINTICSYMSSLTAEKKLDETDKTKYGLDDPIEVSVTENDKVHTIYVGDPTPTYESYYVMTGDDSPIFLIDYTYGSILCVNKDSLKSTRAFPYSYSLITKIAVYDGNDPRFVLNFDKNKNGWIMDLPFHTDNIYSSDVNEVLDDFTNTNFYSFVEENLSEADYSKYGFDKPQYKMTAGTDESSTTIIIGTYNDDETQVYGLVEGSGQVVTFEVGNCPPLGCEITEVIQPMVYCRDISEVESVDVDLNGTKALIEVVNSNENKYKFNGEDVPSESVSLLGDFYTAFNTAEFETYDAKQKPKGDVEVTITYKLKDGTKTKLEYIPIKGGEENTYWVMNNGEYSGFIVRKKVVAHFTTQYEALEKALK